MTAKTGTVPQALLRHRSLIAAATRDAVARLPELLRRPVAYHLGWVDQDGREVAGDGGKAVRPTLTLLAAEAVGGDPRSAVAGAVALELVHNFSLLHDDVMDGDRERRHRATVWAVFGVNQAIIAGDALLTLATELALADAGEAARRATDELMRGTAEMIQGQAEDLSFESRLDVTLEESLAMSEHKTAALLSCATVLGGVLGGGDDRQVAALRGFGRHLGVAFQAVDDLLGIWGEPAVTGKPVASDLRQRKKSIPVVYALSRGGARAERLRALLSAPEDPSGAPLEEAVALLEASGSRSWTAGLADQRLGQALAALESVPLQAEAGAELREIALFVARRDF